MQGRKQRELQAMLDCQTATVASASAASAQTIKMASCASRYQRHIGLLTPQKRVDSRRAIMRKCICVKESARTQQANNSQSKQQQELI